jgi:hypothetical protein
MTLVAIFILCIKLGVVCIFKKNLRTIKGPTKPYSFSNGALDLVCYCIPWSETADRKKRASERIKETIRDEVRRTLVGHRSILSWVLLFNDFVPRGWIRRRWWPWWRIWRRIHWPRICMHRQQPESPPPFSLPRTVVFITRLTVVMFRNKSFSKYRIYFYL